jgi:uncharacterized membrane protein
LAEKKTTAEMVSEGFRDVGILVFVFAPLYQLFEPNRVPWNVFVKLLLFGIWVFGMGIIVERRRA